MGWNRQAKSLCKHNDRGDKIMDKESYFLQQSRENKQLKAENIKLKETVDRQWKLLEQCGVYAGGELKRVSYLFEELRKENGKLREEKEECLDSINVYVRIADKYKSCLQEIKEIAGRINQTIAGGLGSSKQEWHDLYINTVKTILQKIAECEVKE